MKIIKQSWQFDEEVNGTEILKKIERAGRTCWKSEDRMTDSSAPSFVKGILSKNHSSVIEHHNITVRIITDRGILAELTRHRIASYSVESTRYANYSKDKFGNEVTFILPVEFYGIEDTTDEGLLTQYSYWRDAIEICEFHYLEMLNNGSLPQLARSVLPNSLKTEIVVTMNLRSWRHFFELRTSKAAHPQMKALARDMLKEFQNKVPVIFDDVKYE